MKIAWLTPFSRRSAIGQCSSVIVNELRAHADVAVFASDLSAPAEAWLPDADLRYLLTLSPDEVLRQLEPYDAAIYNLGDNLAFHRQIYEAALARPGIAILHDLVVHHFFSGYHFEYRKDRDGYVRELALAHGAEGEQFGRDVLAGRVVHPWGRPPMLRFHMAKSALHGSDGVIVHSEYSRRILAELSEAPVLRIPFPAPPIADDWQDAEPRDVLATGRELRLLTFGMINSNKMVAEVIEAIAASPVLRRRVVYDVLGQTDHDLEYADRLRRLIDRHGLGDTVALLGRRSDRELHERLRRADLIINLRNPHFGESSWSLLESTFVGKPTVVWRHGFYDEFPDDAVAKVGSVEELAATLERLCRDDAGRVALGRRGREYARQTFSTAQYGRRFLEFVDRTHYNRPVLRLADRAASSLRELGQTSASSLTAQVAHEIAALGADASDIAVGATAGEHGS